MDEQKQTMGEEQGYGQPGYGAEVLPQGQQVPPQVQPGYGQPAEPPVPPQVQSGYGMPVETPVQPGYGQPVDPPMPPVQPGYGMPPVPPQGQQIPPQVQSGYGMPVEPPVPSVSPQVQPGYGMPPQLQMPYQTMPPYGYAGKSTDSTGLAIASMVLGIVSIVICSWQVIGLGCGIAGLVLGCVYRAKGGANGMSIAGIVCSSVGLALGLLIMFDWMVEYLANLI